MLGPREVVPYLQACGYLTGSGSALDGITIEDASRRNHNLKVLRQRGVSYFLKQATDADGASHLAHEASIYQFLRANGRQNSLGRCLPGFLGYDANNRLLVLEFVRNSRGLREHYARTRRFPVGLSAAMARALADLHRLEVRDELVLRRSAGLPWIFNVHRPGLRHWRGLSGASLQVIEIIQSSPEFCSLLDGLQQEWRSDAFIHFDAKWDNWVVVEPTTRVPTRGLRIVDWELAGLGDACWDVASVLADYLSLWRLSVLLLDDRAPEYPSTGIQGRLERMQPAMREFWRTYVRSMHHAPGVANALLVRTTRFAAVRLLQIAVERAQGISETTSTIVGQVQLSLNILQRPIEAIVHLLGIRLSASPR